MVMDWILKFSLEAFSSLKYEAQGWRSWLLSCQRIAHLESRKHFSELPGGWPRSLPPRPDGQWSPLLSVLGSSAQIPFKLRQSLPPLALPWFPLYRKSGEMDGEAQAQGSLGAL